MIRMKGERDGPLNTDQTTTVTDVFEENRTEQNSWRNRLNERKCSAHRVALACVCGYPPITPNNLDSTTVKISKKKKKNVKVVHIVRTELSFFYKIFNF